jgi:hypothetical protein
MKSIKKYLQKILFYTSIIFVWGFFLFVVITHVFFRSLATLSNKLRTWLENKLEDLMNYEFYK